jgi:replicative superfamily II helicase
MRPLWLKVGSGKTTLLAALMTQPGHEHYTKEKIILVVPYHAIAANVQDRISRNCNERNVTFEAYFDGSDFKGGFKAQVMLFTPRSFVALCLTNLSFVKSCTILIDEAHTCSGIT